MILEDSPPFHAKRMVAGITLLLFAGALLYSLYFMVRSPQDDTPPQAYAQAFEKILPELKAGDRVLIHPPWREDVWSVLSSGGRIPAGVEVNSALSRPHGATLQRVWVLHDGSAPLPRSLRKRLHRSRRMSAGAVEILSFGDGADGAGGTQLLDSLLPKAEVQVVAADGKTTRCEYRPSQKRHICPGLPTWMYVGEHEVTAAGQKHSCLWNHPTSGGRVVTRFTQVELPAAFELSHALSDRAASLPDGADVEIEIRVDGEKIGKVTHPNRKGWQTDTLSLARRPATASSKPTRLGDVEVEVRTQKDGMRHFCWSIRSRKDVP